MIAPKPYIELDDFPKLTPVQRGSETVADVKRHFAGAALRSVEKSRSSDESRGSVNREVVVEWMWVSLLHQV
jgi:hypothetical protein